MSFRIVKINNRCKLEVQLGYLVCRNDKETRILLDEISLLIIESQQVCITTALLSELINHKVRVILCDNKHNPQSEILPYHACFDTRNKIISQINWSQKRKDKLWKLIIYQKIRNQAIVLSYIKEEKNYSLLRQYLLEIEDGDVSNREGLAAKQYFYSIFGRGFDRNNDSDIRNIFLNYGYTLLLSLVNREISNCGYLTALGIHHIGKENPYNLGCDFVEPFRPFVDLAIIKGTINENNYKSKLIELLTEEISSNSNNSILQNAVHDYCLSAFSFLNNENENTIINITFKNEQL